VSVRTRGGERRQIDRRGPRSRRAWCQDRHRCPISAPKGQWASAAFPFRTPHGLTFLRALLVEEAGWNPTDVYRCGNRRPDTRRPARAQPRGCRGVARTDRGPTKGTTSSTKKQTRRQPGTVAPARRCEASPQNVLIRTGGHSIPATHRRL